jgi:AraC-like DNA-binding protein
VASQHPALAEIDDTIRHALATGRTRREDVAQLLYISDSTLTRVLKAGKTGFTARRRQVRLDIALKRLTEGQPAAVVARDVGVSRDHLCVIVREETGLTPRQIIRAKHLSDIVVRWQRRGPPAERSTLYRQQFREWKKIDDELQHLLQDLGPSHPLAEWAKTVVVAAGRPDFRRNPYRARVRARRQEEAEQDAARMQRFNEALRRALDPEDATTLLETLIGEDGRNAKAA